MRRPAPLTIRQKQNAYQRSQPLLQHNRSNRKQVAFDAATEYFKKYKSDLTDTLQSLFGTAFFARAALWLDPYSQFQNTNGIIVDSNRDRVGSTFVHEGKIFDLFLNEFGQNYNLEAPTKIFPLIMSEVGRSEEVVDNADATSFVDWMSDTTRKSRASAYGENPGDQALSDSPPFGCMSLLRHVIETIIDPHLVQRSSLEYTHRGLPGTFEYQQYSLDRIIQTCQIGGACTSVSGPVFVPDIETLSQRIGDQHAVSLIQRSIASRRVSNLAYNVYELKDIPRLVRQILDLQALIQLYIDKPKQLKQLDRDISQLYLSFQFGIKSTYDAFKGLMELPEKATKRLNYLIRRNGKVSTGKSDRVVVVDTKDYELPTFTFHLPAWMSVADEEVKRTCVAKLRCTVNQTIQFPQLAVPSVLDKDYLKLLGVAPTAEDFYNIIPFSWLVDYFVGIGDYIGILSAIHDDRQLINYGFLAIDIEEVLEHKVNITVLDQESHSVLGVGLVESTSKSRVIPYYKKYTRTYKTRMSIGDLSGVKSVGSDQGNLNDFQYSILFSLFNKRPQPL
jgi:hypothetical protein